jgi:hypothetical protein
MGTSNSGNYRAAKRETDSLYSLCDKVVREALAEGSGLTKKEKADLAIKVTVKRIPTSIAPAGEYAEFMQKLLAKGDLLARNQRGQDAITIADTVGITTKLGDVS